MLGAQVRSIGAAVGARVRSVGVAVDGTLAVASVEITTAARGADGGGAAACFSNTSIFW